MATTNDVEEVEWERARGYMLDLKAQVEKDKKAEATRSGYGR